MRKMIAAFWSLFLICGCVSSQMMPVGDATYAPRPEDHLIEVFLPTDAPVVVHKQVANSRPLSDLPVGAFLIGRIDTEGAPAASWSSVFNDARQKARRLGGDAVVVKRWGAPLTGVDSYGQAYYGKGVSMEVYRYAH